MDSFLVTGLGLCVRVLVDMGSHGDVRVGGSLVGVWEGVVLHHFITKAPKLWDPYLAYGIRILLDLILTESVSKMMVVMLWTALGVVASDVVVGPIFASRSRPRHAHPKPPQPLQHALDSKIRFHRSRTSLQFVPSPRIAQSLQSTSIITPQATPASVPSLPTLPPSDGISSEFDNGPPALASPPSEVMPGGLGPLLPPSPISLTPREQLIPDAEYNDVLPLEEQHDYDALPPHVRHSFQVDVGSEDSSPTNSPDKRYFPEAGGPSCPASLPIGGSVPPREDEFAGSESRSEVHHESDHDRTPTNQPVLLPDPGPGSAPDATETSPADILPVDLQTPPPETPATMEEDDIAPLPIMIQPIMPIPSFSNDLEAGPTGDTTLLDAVSVPESEQTRAERESTISAGNRETLISRGDLLRAQANTEERERARLETEHKRAFSEGRRKDVLLLEGELEQASERIRKLHERAARRYFLAHNLTPEPLTIDVHRLRVPEAIRATKKAIRETLLKDGTQLRVIVGRGNHSRHKTPVLKYQIRTEMQRQKIACAEDRFNGGVLVITLPTT